MALVATAAEARRLDAAEHSAECPQRPNQGGDPPRRRGHEAVGPITRRGCPACPPIRSPAPPLYRAARSLPPYESEDIKPVLEHLRARLEPSDRVYVYSGAGAAFRYYASQYGIGADGVLFGECHYGHPRRHFEELDRLRGSGRVWLLFTHALPDYDEPRDLLAYLDAIGTRVDTLIERPRAPAGSFAGLGSAELYRFDLSDPARLALASATTSTSAGHRASTFHRENRPVRRSKLPRRAKHVDPAQTTDDGDSCLTGRAFGGVTVGARRATERPGHLATRGVESPFQGPRGRERLCAFASSGPKEAPRAA
jgi:hypothetical protein